MKKYIYISVFFILLIIACNDEPPVDESKFVKVYTVLISAPDSLVTDTLSFANYKQEVFRKFELSEEDYRNVISYFNKKPERWTEFFEKVIRYIETTNDSSASSL